MMKMSSAAPWNTLGRCTLTATCKQRQQQQRCVAARQGCLAAALPGGARPALPGARLGA
jgi:hypothetical protein